MAFLAEKKTMDTIPQIFHVLMQEHCTYKHYNVHFVSLHIFIVYPLQNTIDNLLALIFVMCRLSMT